MTSEIRLFTDEDWPAVWEIIHEVVRAGDTFTYDPAMTASAARATWIEAPPGRTVVAVSGDRVPGTAGDGGLVPGTAGDGGLVLGTAKMGPNRGGPGAHVATASFMVAAAARGQGIGTALCRSTIEWARRQGYAAIQFNAVAETNTSAVGLYLREGFQVIGTVPRAFEHPEHGRVGLHVMHLEF